MKKIRANVMICSGTGCISGGNLKIKAALEEEIEKKGLKEEIEIVMTGCYGYCPQGPVMSVQPDGIFYQSLTIEEVPKIVEQHLLKGRPYDKLVFKEPEKRIAIPLMGEIPFFKHQVLRVLMGKGIIDPENLEEYIARDGFQAAMKALTQMTPEEIVEVVKVSGLRGRGGAGFPTGVKWETALKTQSDVKYVVGNRAIMELNPYAVIEGMIICARAIGAQKGYIYIRSEYPLWMKRFQTAITKCNEAGLLGENILDTGFNLDLDIYQGPSEFISGEATALLNDIEGKRGMPRPKLWRSSVKGLWGKPTVTNNLETFANISPIILNGADWFRSVGTEQSPGTKVFTLSGATFNTGLVEVPLGTTFKQIIYDIGGGMKVRKRKLKAVQLGGSSGGIIPAAFVDMPVTYEDLLKAGAIMGSGLAVVMDDRTCMVNVAKFSVEVSADESCGKCVPCRVGNRILLDILTDIAEGRGREGDIELLEDISHDIIGTSLCNFGKLAPSPILTTIKYFRNEYEAHIKDKWCFTGACRDLATFYIDEKICKGCGMCLRACPAKAIFGEKKKPHKIMQDLCLHCKTCYDTCKFYSIKVLPATAREASEEELKELAAVVGAQAGVEKEEVK